MSEHIRFCVGTRAKSTKRPARYTPDAFARGDEPSQSRTRRLLTDAERTEVAQLYSSGDYTRTALAKHFDVGVAQIRDAIAEYAATEQD
ncbi:hypothetical protein KXD97_09975 [Mycobacterium sp. SMC-8]|nr:hypothetical protein KXD97_09975 [Mycobacterium sp. SMC-8]